MYLKGSKDVQSSVRRQTALSRVQCFASYPVLFSCEHTVPSAVRSLFGPKPVQPFGHLTEISYSLQVTLRGVRWNHKCCPRSLHGG